MSEELKPCPFCGGIPYWCGDCEDDPHTCHQITCSCNVQIDVDTEEVNAAETMDECRLEMAKSWNQRAPITIDQAKRVLAEAGFEVIKVANWESLKSLDNKTIAAAQEEAKS